MRMPLLCSAVLSVLALTSAYAADESFAPWGYDLSARDLGVRPGDDFFRYANGAWVERTTIPGDHAGMGMHRAIADRTLEQLRDIMEKAARAPASSTERKVGDYYASYMDDARIDTLGARPLAPLLDAVRAATTRTRLAALMGRTNRDFEDSFFGIGISPDSKDPEHYALSLSQAGLGMPDRDYYLQKSFAPKKAAYRIYIAQQLTLLGWPEPQRHADAIIALETRIAQVSWTREQDRDVTRLYNPMGVAELATLAPGFDWRAFLGAADLSHIPRIIVGEKTALPKIAAIFAHADVDTLQAWQAFRITDNAAVYLASPFLKAYFDFHSRALTGQTEMRARWKYAVHTVGGGDILFGERSESFGCLLWAVGDLYVARYFPPATRASAVALVDTLKTAMSVRLQRVSWMSDTTKAKAQEKLKTLTVMIGSGPDKRDYSTLVIRADDLLGNARRVGEFEWARATPRPGKPVDRGEWVETPQTVNDYEDPTLNAIAFPAAYLQPPLFDPKADPAVNYGAAGLIAHEMTHGFDDQGRKFDAAGRLVDWWTTADTKAFESRIESLGAQYSAYEVLPGLHVNGGLTMGENIADLGGLLIAYDAYHASLGGRPAPVLDGLTGDQRFFLGWAQVWRTKQREDSVRSQIVGDEHSPPGARVDVPLQNIDAWYAAFGVKPGDKRYVAPDARVRIW